MPSSISGRLARPVVSNLQDPTQVDRGALVYWGICMACHGDIGQGLTDEWRAVYGPDMNCFTSKCHGADHPPEGFFMPPNIFVPPVIGPATLARFATAQNLEDFIAADMPWWNPGSLSTDQAWSVTAYLLQKNGRLPSGVVLSASNASAIRLH
jgi:cytochrome c